MQDDGPAVRRLGGALGAALTDALDLVLPLACAGCDTPAAVLCEGCAAALRCPATLAWPSPTPVGLPPPWAVASYAGVARAVILAHKEEGRSALCGALGVALAVAVQGALAADWRAERRIVLVPMPSRRAAVRARGHNPTLAVAREAGRALRRTEGASVAVLPVLRFARSVTDQSGLSAEARAANVGQAVVLPRRLRPLLGAEGLRYPALSAPVVVLVDDIITTGATLGAAAETLRRAGVVPHSAAVVAATQRRTRGVSSLAACG